MPPNDLRSEQLLLVAAPLRRGVRRMSVVISLVAALVPGAPSRWNSTSGADEERPRSKFNRVLTAGDDAPDFDGLLGIDGKRHSLADLKEANVVVVMFIRNLCPTTHLYEPRLREFAKQFADQPVELVAISVSRNPAEGLDRMAVRAKDKGYTWPYLHDESQFTGQAYGATVTPQFFVLDGQRKIAYMGAFDDNFKRDQVKEHYVADAVSAVLAGKSPETVETLARGCEIEFTTSAADRPEK